MKNILFFLAFVLFCGDVEARVGTSFSEKNVVRQEMMSYDEVISDNDVSEEVTKEVVEKEKAQVGGVDEVAGEEEEKEDKKKTRLQKRREKLAEERAKEEFRMQKAAFEKERAEFERERLLVQTQKELSTKNVPIEFAEMLVRDDAESTKEAIDNFANLYTQSVEKGVSNKLKGRPPKTKSTPNNDGLDRASFMKLSLAEQQKMARENPERYKELTQK